jgi:hypothetical protein
VSRETVEMVNVSVAPLVEEAGISVRSCTCSYFQQQAKPGVRSQNLHEKAFDLFAEERLSTWTIKSPAARAIPTEIVRQ